MWRLLIMKKQFLSLLLLVSFIISISAQEKEARQIDEFGILPCGDMLARLHNLYLESQKTPDSKIYVIYYGGRFRKEHIWSKKGARIQLKYPHRIDALNRAKAIPLLLTTEKPYAGNNFEERIVLIDGGFRQNMETELWIVPNGAALPVPTPTIIEKDIKFKADKPYGTPEYARCYDAY